MGAQDQVEKALKDLYVLLSECEVYDKEKSLVIVDKKRFIKAVNDLNQGIYGVMDEYELTKQSRDKAEREVKKRGDEIIRDANKKAEDVYAASVLYTDEALKRVQYIIQDSMDSVKSIYEGMYQKLEQEKHKVKSNQTELNGFLQDLKDTDKYLQIIEERNKKLAKEKSKEKDEVPAPSYAAAKPEIRINEAYFREHGLSLEEEEQPEEKVEKVAPEISVNLDSEYFKWKERENAGSTGVTEEKRSEKKMLFGKKNKGR